MHLGYMICMVMYLSGVRIGMETTQREQSPIQKGHQRESTVCCVVGRSTSVNRVLALPSGSTARRPIGTSTLGFVWRGQNNYCLAPLLLYCLLAWYLKEHPRRGNLGEESQK